MGHSTKNEQYSDEEATRRMNEALRRALTSPPKLHSEMKIGRRKAKNGMKANPEKRERSRKEKGTNQAT
jgi:hypothetical protein